MTLRRNLDTRLGASVLNTSRAPSRCWTSSTMAAATSAPGTMVVTSPESASICRSYAHVLVLRGGTTWITSTGKRVRRASVRAASTARSVPASGSTAAINELTIAAPSGSCR
ncbi:MAG: hypothetical protein H0U21_08720 [Acidimicrobiia bacterium]|nr:hypothetical protein [Acidimicrobiia bacterium]